MSRPIRLCIIGAGAFANFAHGPSLQMLRREDPSLELAAVADLDSARAARFAQSFGFARSYGDWRRMLSAESPDGVCVLTQVSATPEVGCAVLSSGYPVMLEKPPGRNRAEISALSAARRKSQMPVMVAFNRRYSPLLNQLMELQRGLCRERVEHIRCDFYRCERFDADFSTTAIHGIDALRHLCGASYDSVSFSYQTLERERQCRNIFLDCRFDNGSTGLISFCPSTGASFERYTMCTRHWTLIAETVVPGGGADNPGRICVYRDASLLRIDAPTPDRRNHEELYLAGYYSENAAFIDHLRHGFPDSDDLAASLDAVEIADALRRRQPSWHPNAAEIAPPAPSGCQRDTP